MTEEKWVTSTEREACLEFVSDSASGRKVRLLAVSFSRQCWPTSENSPESQFVDIAERIADGVVTEEGVTAALNALEVFRKKTWLESEGDWDLVTPVFQALLRADVSISGANFCAQISERLAGYSRKWGMDIDELHVEQMNLIRDIFGNPFRPVAFDPRWRTGDTVGLARGIYEDRAFDRLLLLADALMDAGCADEQVLGHCQSEGPHVRGCWVVDLVLGKE
jgi:hypothetical protein